MFKMSQEDPVIPVSKEAIQTIGTVPREIGKQSADPSTGLTGLRWNKLSFSKSNHNGLESDK